MRYKKEAAVKVFNFQSHSHARSKQFYWTMVDNAYFTPEISFVRGNIPHLANMHSEHENNFQLLNILRASKQFLFEFYIWLKPSSSAEKALSPEEGQYIWFFCAKIPPPVLLNVWGRYSQYLVTAWISVNILNIEPILGPTSQSQVARRLQVIASHHRVSSYFRTIAMYWDSSYFLNIGSHHIFSLSVIHRTKSYLLTITSDYFWWCITHISLISLISSMHFVNCYPMISYLDQLKFW